MNPPDLPELLELTQLRALAGARLETRVLCEVTARERRFPVQAFLLGSTRPDAPAVGFFGGVHGLERIGAQVVIAYLRSLVMRLAWDETLHRQLETMRLVFMPLVNPGGMWLRTRANPNGVDLMRNAPVESEEHARYLVGGQRISAKLPWYRGAAAAPMQCESAALRTLVETELLGRPLSMAVDCHSGFGLTDRIWFPYAHTTRPIEHLAEMHALCEILDHSLLHHRYKLEPQSQQYLAHGDLWDHLYLRADHRPGGVFLPLTLEMGSWLWVEKNPRQLFLRHGIFNPVVEHRPSRRLTTCWRCRWARWWQWTGRAAPAIARGLCADRRVDSDPRGAARGTRGAPQRWARPAAGRWGMACGAGGALGRAGSQAGISCSTSSSRRALTRRQSGINVSSSR